MQTALEERVAEGLAEVLAHGAVQHEVYGRVYQHQDIHDVAERLVDLTLERRQDAAEQVHDTLRELGDEEQGDDREQHGRRAVRRSITMWVDDAVGHAHVASRSLHLLHRPQQQEA